MAPCSDAATAATLLDKAMRHRKIGAHDLNSRGNRSHCMMDISLNCLDKRPYRVSSRRITQSLL